MDEFCKKYDIKKEEKEKDYHRNRRMFCIYKGELIIAKSNLSYSHAVWFEKEGWISKEDDALMDDITRGIVSNKGDVSFYVGHDFQINRKAEMDFFTHLKELVEKLELKSDNMVFGGAIKQNVGEVWPPRKKYGRIMDILELTR